MYYFFAPSLINKIELHYFFTDDSHQMDAFVRNKSETEILAIIREVATITGIKLKVETEPYLEGGLREIIKFTTKNKFFAPIITSIISGVITGLVQHQFTKDDEFDDLQKQKIKLEIKKLERDLNEYERTNSVLDTKKTADFISINSSKIVKHKSNFFKSLNNYPKISSVSFRRLNSFNAEIALPVIIERKDFNKYILDTDELPIIVDEQAEIEIISPVLKPGSFKWKGYYSTSGETIDFFMKDNDFKKDITENRITFRNGTRINCILTKTRKLTETGEIINSSFSVIKVLSVSDGQAIIETAHGKIYKKERELLKNQLALFTQNDH